MNCGLRRATVFLSLFVWAISGPSVLAAEVAGFTVEGQVKQALHLTTADLKKMNSAEIDLSFESQGRIEKNHFAGVPLLDLLNQAGVIDGEGKGGRFRRVIEIAGSDGYVVAVAIGEIEPNLEGKQILVAYTRDGQPVGPRLVVPGDKHGARSVRDVMRITVK